MDLGVSAWLHQCCANSDCNANSDNHLQSLGKEQSDQPPSSGLNSTMPLFFKYISCIESLSSDHLHVLTLTFDHPEVAGTGSTISSYISASSTQRKKHWGRPAHIVRADDCWQWKMQNETTCFLWTSSSGRDGWSSPVSQTWPRRRRFNGFSIRSPKLWCWVDGSSPQLGSFHNSF